MAIPERKEPNYCRPLLESATPRLYCNNAFRITGLPVDAAIREITRHADRLKIMEELGQGGAAHATGFSLNPPPTVDQIRDAIHRLKDAERRIIEEFFWFWPKRFEHSEDDPSIRLLAAGDIEGALRIWEAEEDDLMHGESAIHNLAVYWHLTALERERDPQPREIEQCWQQSLKRWKRLADNELFWGRVASRVKQLDDPRLTTGFVRRMRGTLPEALDKINAQLAVRYMSNGKRQWAEFHAGLMGQTHGRRESMERTVEMILAPAKSRLRERIQQAKRAAEANSGTADKAALDLIQHTRPQLELFELFRGKNRHTCDDLFDEVASLSLNYAILYQRRTGDDWGFIALLELALPLAAAIEVRQRIEDNLGIGRNNLEVQKKKPLYDKLHAIQNSSASLSLVAERIRKELLPDLVSMGREMSAGKHLVSELYDAIALALRDISFTLHNIDSDTAHALDAIELACELVHDVSLGIKLRSGRDELKQIRQRQLQHRLFRRVRDDEIEIDHEMVRLNSRVFPITEITGVRYGIGSEQSWGIVKRTFLIEIAATGSRTLTLDCKRAFRSEEQALEDFQAIVDEIRFHIAPKIAARIAKEVLGGEDYPVGTIRPGIKLSKRGMRFVSYVHYDGIDESHWTEKETRVIPYPDLLLQIRNGDLFVGSKRTNRFYDQAPIISVWNAPIIGLIAEAISCQLNETD